MGESAVVAVEDTVPTEQVPTEGQGERRDPRGRFGKNCCRQGGSQPIERAKRSEHTEDAVGKDAGGCDKQQNRSGKPQSRAGGQNQNRGNKGPKGGKDSKDVSQYMISGAYDLEVDTGGILQPPKMRELTSDDDAPKLHKILVDAGLGSHRNMGDLVL